MTTHWDDVTLAAYALNELEEAERASVEERLKSDAAARRTVAEFRAAAKLATAAAAAAAAPGLTDEQQRAIREKARAKAATSVAPGAARSAWYWVSRLALVATVLIILSALIMPRTQTWHERGTLGDAITDQAHGSASRAWYTDLQKLPPAPGPAAAPAPALQVAAEMMGRTVEGVSAQAPGQEGSSPVEPSGAPIDRYLIKNVTLQLETENAQEACKQLTQAAVAAGGYVSNMQEMVDGLGRRNISLQVRVPADRLDGTMQSIEALGRVLNKQVSTQDVTEEYVDTDARIRNLTKTEERLLEHLSKTGQIDNTLKIEQEMTRVREQLERLEGRLRYLSHSVRFSTISVTLSEKPKAEPVMPVETFSTGKVLSEAVRSLVLFSRALWVRAIWGAVWSPVWGVIVVAGWLVFRRLRKAGHLRLW